MIIRSMQPDDLDFCVECVTNEGWLAETRAVFETFYAYDPLGCLIAEDNGRPVGICVATAYEHCGFIGELIVIPERRGRGVGRKLMEVAIGYLHDRGCESIYLDADTQAVPLYERLGFRHVCRSLRFLGRIAGRSHSHVRRITQDDLGAVLELDRDAFGADRSFFLTQRFELFPQYCKMLVCDNEPAGYVMGQPGHGVVTVGPWYTGRVAENPLVLLENTALETGNLKLRVGILETNAQASEMMRALDSFEETEPSWRMVMGPDCNLGVSRSLISIGSAASG